MEKFSFLHVRPEAPLKSISNIFWAEGRAKKQNFLQFRNKIFSFFLHSLPLSAVCRRLLAVKVSCFKSVIAAEVCAKNLGIFPKNSNFWTFVPTLSSPFPSSPTFVLLFCPATHPLDFATPPGTGWERGGGRCPCMMQIFQTFVSNFEISHILQKCANISALFFAGRRNTARRTQIAVRTFCFNHKFTGFAVNYGSTFPATLAI